MRKENRKNETQNEIHRERETERNASVISLGERHTEILVSASIHRRKKLVSIAMHFDPTKGIVIVPISGRMYC